VHRLYVPKAVAGAGLFPLSSEQERHLAVLRLLPGAAVEAFDGEGRRFRAELAANGLQVLEELPQEPPRRVDVVLAQALTKGEKMELVVQKATELGASRVVPLITERAVVRLEGERGAVRAERWRKVAQEAARQCGRADVPRIDEPSSWDELFALLREEPRRSGILLDPLAKELRLGAAVRGAARLLIAVGPEGGLSAAECDRGEREGLVRASLGPLVLRTETAGLAALCVALHVHGELG
jgi:16S rRNA (uracil1498-N3)-methyltransferase